MLEPSIRRAVRLVGDHLPRLQGELEVRRHSRPPFPEQLVGRRLVERLLHLEHRELPDVARQGHCPTAQSHTDSGTQAWLGHLWSIPASMVTDTCDGWAQWSVTRPPGWTPNTPPLCDVLSRLRLGPVRVRQRVEELEL